MGNTEILVRGDAFGIEIVLRDQKGTRASRECRDGHEVMCLLDGWSRAYDLDTDVLFIAALETASPEVRALTRDWCIEPSGQRLHRFMSPKGIERMMELAEHSYRPREILDLKRKIAGAREAAEAYARMTGVIDFAAIEEVVGMRRHLDRLYGAWVEGQID